MKRWLLVISFALIALGLALIQTNDSTAKKMAADLVAKDQAGQDVSNDVVTLSDFVGGHMGASVSFELKGSYDRAVQAAQAAAAPDVSGQVYAQAQAACAHGDSIVQANCVRSYVASHTQPVATKPLVMPVESDYVHDFKSPSWTPDPAGISLAAGFAALLVSAWLSLFRR